MVKDEIIIRLLDLSIIQELTKGNNELPIASQVLFDSEKSYYKHIRFNINIAIDNYRLRPSFYFSNFMETCQELCIENGKRICYTPNFIITLDDALNNGEIEVVKKNEVFTSKEHLDLKTFKKELIELDKLYQQGLVTEKELNSHIVRVNSFYCTTQNKWNKIVRDSFFEGGVNKVSK